MPYLIGAVLALGVGAVLGTAVGLDRDRAFYTTVAAVVASYYVLFATMAGSTHALLIETGVAMVFLTVALTGFRGSFWLVAPAPAGARALDAVPGPALAQP